MIISNMYNNKVIIFLLDGVHHHFSSKNMKMLFFHFSNHHFLLRSSLINHFFNFGIIFQGLRKGWFRYLIFGKHFIIILGFNVIIFILDVSE